MTDPVNKARLTPMSTPNGAAREGTPVPVHFNPQTLTLTIRNQMEQGQRSGQRGRPPQQLVSSSEVTLAVELVFDTTLTGTDVRQDTARIAEMMRPGTAVPREQGKRRPAVVKFEWNEFAFQGTITDYNETLDYFSAEGIPLRSNLSLSITKHEDAFPRAGGGSSGVGAGPSAPTVPVASGDSADDVAMRSGNPGRGPAIAASNGVEDLRNVDADELASPDAAAAAAADAGAFGSPLAAGAGFGAAAAGRSFGAGPVAFASGDTGFGLDLGASAGVSAGLSAGAGASLAAGAAASLGGGAGLAGGLELEAFAGLNAPSAARGGASLGGVIDFDLPDAPGLSAGLSLGAGVSLGGAASASFGAGAGVGGSQVASVGKEINLADILFQEDR